MERKELKKLEKYKKYLEVEAEKFKLTPEDLGNLFDLSYMIGSDVHDTLELNKIDKWYNKFFGKIEKIVVPELYDK